MNYTLACLLTFLLVTGCTQMHRNSTPEADARNQDREPRMSPSEQAEYVAIATNKWQTYFRQTLKPNASLDEVERLMMGKYRDKGKFHLGGSGNYELLYLVDDVCQIRFAFTVDDYLDDMPEVEARGVWIREPDGRLMVDARG